MGVVDKAFDAAGNVAESFGKGVQGLEGIGQKAHDELGAKQVENQLSNYVQAYGPAATLATIAAITGGAGAAAFGAGAGAGAGAAEGGAAAGGAGGGGAVGAGSSSAFDSAALADQTALAAQGTSGAGELSQVPALAGSDAATLSEQTALAGQGAAGAGELSNVPALSGQYAMPAAVPPTPAQLANTGLESTSAAAAGGAAGGAAGQSTTQAPQTQTTTQPQAPSTQTQAPTSTQPGGTPQQPGMVDRILSQMKNNPLATAGTALLGAQVLGAKPKTPQATQQENAGAQDVQATAQQLLAQYRSGALSPGQQSSLDQLTNQTKNQLRQYFASIGQADSTAATQALAQVDSQALQMKQQMLDNALNQGLQAIGISGGQLAQIAQVQLGQDRALNQAFSNFAGSLGNIAGSRSGTPTTVAPTISSTQA